MSGYLDYFSEEFKFSPHYQVESVVATPDNFKDYGHFVEDYENEDVIIKPWPVKGWRKLMGNTGTEGGIAEGKFEYKYLKKDNQTYLSAISHAVGGDYTTGINYLPTDKDIPDYILTREANYHPDSGQVFYPINSIDPTPFILLLALPGDDIKLEDFVAFKFDGVRGAQIKPDIWHQPLYPLVKDSTFMTKQGKVHGCVGVDTITEFDTWLKVDLT